MSEKGKTRYLKKIVNYNMAISTIVCGIILAICWRMGIMDAYIAGAVLTPWAIENVLTMLIKRDEKRKDKQSKNYNTEDTSI